MDNAVKILQKFATDVRCGQIPKDKLRFGAPWRHPPSDDNPTLSLEWAKLQLLDFVQSLINAEFGVLFCSALRTVSFFSRFVSCLPGDFFIL